jgi:hypothetical protein
LSAKCNPTVVGHHRGAIRRSGEALSARKRAALKPLVEELLAAV